MLKENQIQLSGSYIVYLVPLQMKMNYPECWCKPQVLTELCWDFWTGGRDCNTTKWVYKQAFWQGAGKKWTLCVFWEANCALKKRRLCGNCAGLRNGVNKQIFDHRAQKKPNMEECLDKGKVLLFWRLNINQISILLQLWPKFVSTKSCCVTRLFKTVISGRKFLFEMKFFRPE